MENVMSFLQNLSNKHEFRENRLSYNYTSECKLIHIPWPSFVKFDIKFLPIMSLSTAICESPCNWNTESHNFLKSVKEILFAFCTHLVSRPQQFIK
jgi:hypothetical protein